MLPNFSVQITEYAERYFIKSFQKKYKGHWDTTHIAIIAKLERVDNLIAGKRVDVINKKDDISIVKMDFAVAGTQMSPRASGNRCILAVHEEKRFVKVLLVYAKTDLSGHNETAEWKSIIRDNYKEYRDLL